MGCVTHVQCIEAAESLPAALTSIHLGFCRVESLMSRGDSRKDYPARVGEREKNQSVTRTCSRVVEQSPYCTQATRTCTDVPPCATSGDLMRVRRQSQLVGHKAWSQAPLRLNRLVNVLPQPGTGHRKLDSFRRLLALAAWVAEVVTCCRSRRCSLRKGEGAKRRV